MSDLDRLIKGSPTSPADNGNETAKDMVVINVPKTPDNVKQKVQKKDKKVKKDKNDKNQKKNDQKKKDHKKTKENKDDRRKYRDVRDMQWKKDELTWGGFVDLDHMWILFKMQLKKGSKSTDRIFHWIIPHKLILCHSMSVFDGVPALLTTITDLESGCCVSCDAQLNLNSFLALY